MRDVWQAFRLLLTPHRWVHGSAVSRLEQQIAQDLGGGQAFGFDSGRSSWYAILQALDLQTGDEVLVQAFTCVVVPNPVIWSGATPVYVDILPDTLNMDPADLERKITGRSRVVLIQHTLGKPADMGAIMRIARKHNLIVIEDCAHSLGVQAENEHGVMQKVGTFGRAAFFSFGRDKVISSVFGGMAFTADEALAERLGVYQKSLVYPKRRWIVQQLLHPILFSVILPLYFSGIGKALLVLFQKLGLLSKAVYGCEKSGKCHPSMPKRLPNAQAELALSQYERLALFTARRQELAVMYREKLKDLPHACLLPAQPGEVPLRFQLMVEAGISTSHLRHCAQQHNILLGDWYSPAIAPGGVNYQNIHFKAFQTPRACEAADRVVNLPTYPKMLDDDIERVVAFLRDYMNTYHGGRVREVTDRNAWDTFVKKHSPNIFLQSWDFGQFHAEMGDRPYYVGVFEGETIIAVALVILIRAKRAVYYACAAGPILDREAYPQTDVGEPVEITIIREITDFLKKRAELNDASFLRWRPGMPKSEETESHFRKLGFRQAPLHLHAERTWVLDVTPDEETLLKNMRKNTRYAVRRAEKDGVTVRKSVSPEDVQILFDLQQETVERQKFVPFSLEYFQKLSKAFNPPHEFSPLIRGGVDREGADGEGVTDGAVMFTAEYEGKPIAAAMINYYGDMAVYHYAASASQYAKLPGAYIILWEAIKEAKARGCRYFNFWGIVGDDQESHPWHGLSRFKKGFGGEEVWYLHAQDYPLSWRYWINWAIERYRKWKRGL